MGVHEGIVIGKMARLRLSRQVLARVANVREGDLCRGLRSIEPLSGAEMLRIDELLTDLENLQKLISPFELPVSDVRKLQILLNRFRDGDLNSVLDPAIRADLAAQIAGGR
jgi:hypothetical protein